MAATCSWPDVNVHTCLRAGEVHACCAHLNISEKLLLRFQRSLDPDELQRASRFRFDIHRKRFIARHGCLREILGRFLNILPGAVQFTYNPYGKPFLSSQFHTQNLNFNLSSSADLALFVFTRGRKIGVDIEKIRQNFDYEDIAERYFSINERRAFRQVKPEHKPQEFYRLWTRKEAYIKARGEGLSRPLNRFDVSVDPQKPAELFVADQEPEVKGCWSLHDLDPAHGYMAALAVQGKDWQLRCWRVAPELFV